tara:strand:- start:2218 stop:2358 length:141 start_codon:yes stop_codon:yes gene_type:complete
LYAFDVALDGIEQRVSDSVEEPVDSQTESKLFHLEIISCNFAEFKL